jgi:hypothetical protein
MAPAEPDEASDLHCRLDELLETRGMTLTRLSELVGVSVVNLSVLKNDRARDPLLDAAGDLPCTRLPGGRAVRAAASRIGRYLIGISTS